MLVGQLFEAVDVLLERGVVDEDVELAELLHRLLHRVLAEFRIGDIARQQNAAAAFLLDGPLGLLGVLVLVEIGDRDVGALARKEHGHRAADAGVAAGDQRDLVEQFLRALVVRRVVHRLELEVGLLPGFADAGRETAGRDRRARRPASPRTLPLVAALFFLSDRSILRWMARSSSAVCSASFSNSDDVFA